ncbi:S-layer homology domain-containing protein [Clostridiisalibacter paucivorans]|uniref:S-layer homology domain-containing protein n=1 Tax=Clostridiisalibacter paucivorans TaxID=408753 RepID=UPI00047E9861|nr:S-layer homology domain-containing protein [Clostridiisalibacter paucivorans]
MKKRILSFLLILTLLFPSFVIAKDGIDVQYSREDERVTISIEGEKSTPVSIIIEDDTKRYYIDQGITDLNGKIEFKTILQEDKEYNCSVKINGEEKKIKISKEKEPTEPIPPIEPDIAYISIRGYKGRILSRTKVEIQKDDTVITLTKRVLRANNIDYQQRSGYIASIDGQAEMDKGSKSGWMFSINGEFPNVGADSVNLRDGDYIKWLYTTNLGEDIGNPYKEEKLYDAYDVIKDENASEEEIIDAIDIINDSIEDSIREAKTEKEMKNVLKDVNKMYKALLQVLQRADTEKLVEEISEKSIDMVEKMEGLLEKNSIDEIRDGVYKISQKNLGMALHLTTKIEKEKTLNKIIDDILKASTYMEKNIAPKLIDNRMNMKKISIFMPNILEDEVDIYLPYEFIKKAQLKGLNEIELNGGLTSFNITPNILGNKKDKRDLYLKAERINVLKLSDKERHMVPDNSIVIELEALLGDEKVSSFEEPIEVSIPYEKNTIKDEDAITVFLLEDDGSVNSVGGLYNPNNKNIKFIANHFSKYFAKNSKGNFKDIGGHWAEREIKIMSGKGIINGRSPDVFSPDDNVSRAEFAALISRMLKYTTPTEAEIPFKDINKNSWYYGSILSTCREGIINGKGNQRFDPKGNITRQEMSKVISKVLENRLYKNGDSKELNIFIDKEKISPWAKQAVALVVREDIMKGVGKNRFEPKQKVTRAQAAVMLYRMYDLILN